MNANQIDDVYKLSPLQSGILFHALYASETCVYLDQHVYTLEEELSVETFKQAWGHLLQRHPVLRTSVHWEGMQEPLQVVHQRVDLLLEQQDWSPLSPAAQQMRLGAYLKEDRARGMDLTQPPLMRVTLIRIGTRTWQVVWTVHHLLLDRWSVSQVLAELRTTYDALRQGGKIDLPGIRPYRDYIRWLRERSASTAEGYWKHQLRGLTVPTALPMDKAPHTLPGGGITARDQVVLSTEVSAALQRLAREHHLTLNTLVQGAWALLLSRYSGEDDVLFGATVSGRPADLEGVESMVGLFINSLPVRVRVPRREPVLLWLKRLQDEMVELREYEYSSLVQIQGWSQIPRGVPLFDSLVVVQNTPSGQRASGTAHGLRLRATNGESSVDFPLMLMAVPGPELRLWLSYDLERYEQQDIGRMLGHYQTLLEGIVADPNRKVSCLPMLMEPEREQLLVEWNATQHDYPHDALLHQRFEQQVQRTPDAIALVSGRQQLTYQELNARSNQVAHHLVKRGIGPNRLVVICMERSLEMVVGMLGVLKAGGAYVPVDPAYPSERLCYTFEDSQAALVLTQERLLGSLPWVNVPVVCLDREQEEIAAQPMSDPVSCASAQDLAYVIYTSGSTGKPKGVAIEHHSPVVLVSWALEQLSQEELSGVVFSTSICFDLSVYELFVTLSGGGRVILVDNALQIASLDERTGATLINTVPSAMAELVRHNGVPGSVLRVNLAGEPLSGRLVDEIYGRSRAQKVCDLYGPSEDTTYTTYALRERGGKETIGRPIWNTWLYVLGKGQEPVPVGVSGELCIGGAGLARGYLNRPDMTAERFVPDPYSLEPGARLYRTGDLCRYLPEGNVEFLGRIDHQVKVRGFRIELGEIESVLGEHPQVREAVVLVREDTPGEKRLVGYVVSRNGALSTGELREHLKAKLPDYMVPGVFVALEALPLSPNGKLDRKALPAPEPGALQDGETVAPRSPIEEGIAQIWAEVLGLEQVGVHDSFFELGGHSLLATQVISRIRSVFQVELPLRALFECATVAELAEEVLERRRRDEGLELPPLLPVLREGPMPLSFAQQRLWFLDQLEPGSSAYNMPSAWRLLGALDVIALERSLGELVRRHEALRTTFVLIDGVPGQMIRELTPLQLPVVDLSGLTEKVREAEAQRLAREEAQRPFDLGAGPLFRTCLLHLGEEDQDLLVTVHHVVSDGWSHGVLMHELTVLYNAFHAGLPSTLPELPVQYADYAAWQRAWLQGDVLDQHLSYWKEHLAGAPALLELPTDRPRPVVQGFRGARTRLELSDGLTQELLALGQQEGVTLFMTLLAAFQTLLYRYSGQDDIVVGTPIANRTRSEVEGLIGCFVNTLALRGDLSGDPSFAEVLRRVRESALNGYAHQDLPFERLVDELSVERSLSHSPIFQVMFAFQNTPGGSVAMEGLEVRPLGSESVTAKYDLTLSFSQRAGRLRLALVYNADLFDADRMERMLGHYQTLLEGIVADPNRKVSSIPLLASPERHQLLVQWNHTAFPFPDRRLHHLVEHQVDHCPNAPAVSFQDSSLSYLQLDHQANRLAHYLRSRGVAPGACVGVAMERSLDLVVALLAVLKAGAAYVPIDPDYPQDRIAYMLKDAHVPVLLSQQQVAARLSGHTGAVVCLDTNGDRIQAQPTTRLESGAEAEDAAYVIYTSGSTGQPRGVVIPHRAIVNHMEWMQQQFPLSQGDRVLQKTPISFDASVWEFWAPLMAGAELVMATPGGHRDPAYLSHLIRERKVTRLQLVPSLLQMLVTEERFGECRSLEHVFCGGEALSTDLQARFQERLGAYASLHNLYGPTEAAIDATSFTCRADWDRASVPIGRPIANLEAYVLDSRQQPVPVGVPGELYLGGAGLARGYLNRPDMTAERFVPDPFSLEPGARLYRTGDLCRYLPDGNIEFLGRIDHQVKVRGFRIELGEIESVLGEHPQVREAVVLVREDTPGEKRLVGYVVSRNGALSTGELREHLKAKLPDYMVPGVFVALEALPLTPNGKVDRKALPEPDGVRPEGASRFVAARTPIEETLAGIWREVLRVEQVGVHDNFFELGGDSILSIQIIARANQAGLRLTPRQVFQHQTIDELAEAARSGTEVEAQEEVTAGAVPLTPIQGWFFEQELEEAHHFNQARLLELRGGIEGREVEEVVQALVRHHDALRLRYVRTQAGWQQRQVMEAGEGLFCEVDLSGVEEQEQASALREAATRLQASLNLEAGPLMRAGYFKMGEGKPGRLLLAIHHLVVDGVSWRVLLEDLAQGLEQRSRGEAVVLPAKTTSFQQWAKRLEEYAHSPALEQELEYWLTEERRWVGQIPVDKREGGNRVASQAVVRVSLEEEETQALLSEVPGVYHTQINDALLCALAQVLAEWSTQSRVLVDLEGHGREALFEGVDLSRTVGWFTSLYPVVLEVLAGAGVGERLKSIKEQLRGVPQRGVGYGLLRYLSEQERERQGLREMPQAQVSFNYHGQFSVAGREGAVFGGARESSGEWRSAKGNRSHLIEVIGQVSGGRLSVQWIYSEGAHERRTIERVAGRYVEALRELIAHCQTAEAGGYTPSDFQTVSISQKALDRLLVSIRR